ncbi:MAG: ParB/RepB/Spo0J family partition protein [Dethiobacteria bacterium]|nr:ParB/RepB/Spo0J family partition protein [Dethiobacteria bacterium]
MSEKRRLGKGLGALIPEVLTASSDTNEISLDLIKPNPFQPRQIFDDGKLDELAASIREHGILQAVLLTPAGEEEGYFLVAGERRCRAAKIAGLTTVPAVIKSLDRKAMLEIALIENLQREDLNPVEEATAYQRLMQEFSYTQEELSRRIGRSRPAIANSIRLLSLPENILEYLAGGDVTPGQVRPLLTISDPQLQQQAAAEIISEGLSAREAEKIATRINAREKKDNGKDGVPVQDPLHVELQLQIQRSLGTKVRFKEGKTGGTIEIYYYSEDDLERLIAKLLPEGV